MLKWMFVFLAVAGAAPRAKADEIDSLLRGCGVAADQKACENSQASFRNDWMKAFKGDYVGQTNVASFLDAGWDGAVLINRPLSCAWRIVLLSSGSTKITDTDALKYDMLCKRKLTATEMSAAHAQAQELYRRIYGRDLVSGL